MTRRLRSLVALAAVLALTGLIGCGRDTPEISDDAAEQLTAKVDELRTRASARDADGVTTTLAELSTLVDQLRADGELSAAAADRITTSAAQVTANVDAITTTTEAPDDKGEDKDEDEDEHGKGGKHGEGRD